MQLKKWKMSISTIDIWYFATFKRIKYTQAHVHSNIRDGVIGKSNLMNSKQKNLTISTIMKVFDMLTLVIFFFLIDLL